MAATIKPKGGELLSIDFGKLCFEETTADITELYNLVKRSPKVMRLCGRVSAMSDCDIEAAFSDIPEPFWKKAACSRMQKARSSILRLG